MERRRLRIGLIEGGFGWGTGPATYRRTLVAAMGELHHLFEVDGPAVGSADLYHVVDAKRLDPVLLASLEAPVILDYHDDYWVDPRRYPAPDWPLRLLRAWQLHRRHLRALPRAARVVVHSRAVAESIAGVMARELGAGERPGIEVVPLGIEPAAGPAADGVGAALGDRGRSEDPAGRGPLILLVGRDLYRKGFATLVRALPLILKALPGARLVAIGDEYPHTRWFARLQARGLPVSFLWGQGRSELEGWYRRAAVVVLPSWREAFGLALLEAMAAGTPVVASRVGGIPEAVEDGVSGLLHEPGDHVGLAEKVIAAVSDPPLRARLIQGGLSRSRIFSAAAMAARLDEVYRSVAEAGR